MKKINLFLSSMLLLGVTSGTLMAQHVEGALDANTLKTIQNSYQNNSVDRALRNAVMAKGMNALVLNSERGVPMDSHFNYMVKSKGIANQESSGRCWLFTGLNVLRSRLINEDKTGPFFFSQNYNFFWDQLEKSNLFLQTIIDTRKKVDDKLVQWLFKNPIGDGGQFTGISENLMKYGVVPASIMPETINSNNTRELNRVLNKTLRQYGIRIRELAQKGKPLQDLMAIKMTALKNIYRVLVMNLGLPPKTFTYTLRDASGKVISTDTYTPQSFYKKFVNIDLRNDFVMLMNDPSRPYYKLYEISYDRQEYDGKNWTYVNLPIEDIKKMAIASIKDNTMMYYSCDVGKDLDIKSGTLALDNYDYADLLGYPFDMTKKERIQTYDSGSTHAMTLMAVNLDASGKPNKWMVENSWGASSGANGHLIMSDKWFDAYTFRLVVNKKYITPKVREVLNTKPEILPPWDPMFRNED